MAERNKANELYITREYNAPLKLVWKAWTDPEHVAKWWGPRGFTLTSHSKDLKTGGSWIYTMHGPDGVDYPNHTFYHEVVPFKKLVYDHGANETQPPLFKVTVEFSELKNKTLMEMTMTLATPEAAQEIKKFIKQAGGESTWDRLAEYLEEKENSKKVFVINRSFETSPEKVFNAWIDPKQLEKWLPPSGLKMEFVNSMIAEGGESFYRMYNNEGFEMFGKTIYHKIVPHSQITSSQQFTDSKGQIIKHPMSPTWPDTVHNTIIFSPEKAGRTRITIISSPSETSTAQEAETFLKERSGMTKGWTGSFDQLEKFLLN